MSEPVNDSLSRFVSSPVHGFMADPVKDPVEDGATAATHVNMMGIAIERYDEPIFSARDVVHAMALPEPERSEFLCSIMAGTRVESPRAANPRPPIAVTKEMAVPIKGEKREPRALVSALALPAPVSDAGSGSPASTVMDTDGSTEGEDGSKESWGEVVETPLSPGQAAASTAGVAAARLLDPSAAATASKRKRVECGSDTYRRAVRQLAADMAARRADAGVQRKESAREASADRHCDGRAAHGRH